MNTRAVTARPIWCVIGVALLLFALPLAARQQSSGTPEQSPSTGQNDGSDQPEKPENSSPAGPAAPPVKDDRIFGLMPNFLTVQGQGRVPPLTAKGKFKLTAQGAFDPYEFVIVGILAGIHQAYDVDNTLGQGAVGYGKRYGIGLADQVSGNFMTGAVFPSLLRQDPRYFQMGRGGFGHRFLYAASRVAIGRSDKGNRQFNYSEFLGNGAAAGLSNLYSPQEDRGWANTGLTMSEQVAIDAFGNELKEFWPDIKRHFKKKKPPQT